MSNIKELAVPGTDFSIKDNTIYTVLPKPDSSAPDGFKEHGTTKVIHPDVGTTVGAPYDTEMKVWDTGFYTHSPCLQGLSLDARKEFIKKAEEFLIKPVEEIKGEGALSHKQNEFYDGFSITLANKAVFNTARPLERLALYFAILGKDLCPKEFAGNPIYGQADYVVVSKEEVISNKEQSEIDNSKAIGEFYSLLNSDRDFLQDILRYMRISDAIIKDENTFISVFNRYLKDKENGYRNSSLFLKQLSKFKTEKGREELSLYISLSDLYDKKIVTVHKSEFYLKGVSIGNSLKHAAMNAVNDLELKKQIVELSAEEDED